MITGPIRGPSERDREQKPAARMANSGDGRHRPDSTFTQTDGSRPAFPASVCVQHSPTRAPWVYVPVELQAACAGGQVGAISIPLEQGPWWVRGTAPVGRRGSLSRDRDEQAGLQRLLGDVPDHGDR